MSEFPFFVPKNYQKGYLRLIMYSVTVAINREIGRVKKAKQKPSYILLDTVCSIKYCHEQTRSIDLKQAPKEHAGLPIHYSVETLVGVVVVPVQDTEPTHDDSNLRKH